MKTGVGQLTEGSNPSPSAKLLLDPALCGVLSYVNGLVKRHHILAGSSPLGVTRLMICSSIINRPTTELLLNLSPWRVYNSALTLGGWSTQ